MKSRSNVGPMPEKVVNDEVAAEDTIDVTAIGGKMTAKPWRRSRLRRSR
jgi:hypothetical protein